MISISYHWIEFKWNWENFISKIQEKSNTMILFFVVGSFVTALGISYMKHWERKLNVQLQSLQNEANELQIEWSQMLVEQNMWAALSRIQDLAVKGHRMKVPQTKDIVVVAPRAIP